MAVGDRVVSNGVEFEVVWSGGDLIGERTTRTRSLTGPTKRIYNKTGKFALKGDCEINPVCSRVCERGTHGCEIWHRGPEVDNQEKVSDDLDNADIRGRRIDYGLDD